MIKIGTEYNTTIDKAVINIGGKTEKFVPNINASKWNNEFWLNINHPDIVNTEKELFEKEKVELTVGNNTHRYYEKDGKLEYEIEFKEKPISNIVEFDLSFSEGLDFYYQDTLENEWKIDNFGYETFEEYIQHFHRAENVVGSYAVYCWRENNKYKTGKFCHIYRPKLIDADKNEIWAELKYEYKKLTITMPQGWLDKARYPVILDPTLGYSTAGSSDIGVNSAIFGTHFQSPASAGTIDTWHCAVHAIGSPATIKMGIYPSDGINTDPRNKALIEQVEFIVAVSDDESNAGSGGSIAASTWYYIGFIPEHSNTDIKYDTGETGEGAYVTSTTYGAQFADPSNDEPWTNNVNKFSLWVDYSAAGGDFEYSGSGVITLSGVSTTEYTKEFSYTGSGKIELSGIADTEESNNYEYSASGKIEFSGVSVTEETNDYLFTPSGKIEFSGIASSEETNDYSVTASGKIEFAGIGISEEYNDYVYSVSGKIEFAGEAETEATGENEYSGSGSITLSGVAETEYSVIYEYTPTDQELESANAEAGDLSQLDSTYVESGNVISAIADAKLHNSYGYNLAFGGSNDLAWISKNLTGDLKDHLFYARFYVKYPPNDYPFRNEYPVKHPFLFGTWDNTGNRYGLYFRLVEGCWADGDPAVYIAKKYYWTGSSYYDTSVASNTLLGDGSCIELFVDRDNHLIKVWIDNVLVVNESGASMGNYVNDEFRVGILESDGIPTNGQKFYLDDLIISSSAIGLYNYPYYRFSGEAITQGAFDYIYTPSGGIVFSGEAETEAPLVVYEYAGSGSIIFSGQAETEIVRECIGSGKIEFTGSVSFLYEPIFEYTSIGKIDFLGVGTSVYTAIFTYTASGEIIFLGIAETQKVISDYIYGASGSIIFSGEGKTSIAIIPMNIVTWDCWITKEVSWDTEITKEVDWATKITKEVSWDTEITKEVDWATKITKEVSWDTEVARRN